ncbi:MAG: hypothetical protein FWG53_08405 [Clostridiales bacterium]|nr:hypothetical protein [Clostridiales bacterium]
MSKATIAPSQQKLLHTKSGNRCAVCKKCLAENDAARSLGENAHIYGEKPEATRYDPNQKEAFVNSEKNLIYVCPGCHYKIDYVRPQDYPVERLFEIKREHEEAVRTLPQNTLDNEKISTHLAEVIVRLSRIEEKPEKDLYDRSYLDYEIQEKIDFNKIKLYEEVINEYKVYQYYLHGENGLYEISTREGGFEKIKIYNRILHVYVETIKNLLEERNTLPFSGDDIYFDVFNKINTMVKGSKEYIEMNDDDLMHCIHIVLVDAFIECKWFENPKSGGGNLGSAN